MMAFDDCDGVTIWDLKDPAMALDGIRVNTSIGFALRQEGGNKMPKCL